MGKLLPAAALLTSFAILCLGHGLQSVLLPARSAMFEHSPNMTAGIMMSAYYAGFILATFVCAKLIARVGHIRIFAAAASCAAAIMLAHALLPHPAFWIALRIIYGFCFLHLYTVMESWLNSLGDSQSRGKILSVYMIINFLAMSGGQLLFFTAPASGFELFSLSAIMLSLSLIPLMLSRGLQPAQLAAPELFGLKQLFRISPLGVAGALVAGLMGGAYWGLTAMFVLKLGFDQRVISWFMAASLVGGLLAQWPLGMLSDRINRRYVILLASLLICLSSLILSWMAWQSDPADLFGLGGMVAIGALFGAGFHPLYSLCIAHANDFIRPEHFVRASAGLQRLQGLGAVAGPLLAGGLMALGGSSMLFLYMSGLTGLLMLYTLARLLENRPVLAGRSAPFQFLTRTGLVAFFMDPRSRRPTPAKEPGI